MNANAIQKIIAGLSCSKLSTYEGLGLPPASHDLLIAYFALQEISSHFFVPLQMLELSLRNNIDTALSARFSKAGQLPWFDIIPKSPESQKQVAQAKQLAKDKKGPGYNHDDVVCRLMFGFWVYLLDKPYRDTQNKNHFWQYEQDVIFPGRNGKSVKDIFSALLTINNIRNRLYHHEPIWKHRKVKDFAGAVRQLQRLHANLLLALVWVCPEKNTMLTQMAFHQRFVECCKSHLAYFYPPSPAKKISVVVPAV